MRVLTTTLLICGVWGGSTPAQSPKDETPSEGKSPELLEVRRIWDRARQSSFGGLVRFQDRWFCTFRESEHGHASPKGKGNGAGTRIITSEDGVRWESVAFFQHPLWEFRDSNLTVLPDGRLMMNTITLYNFSPEEIAERKLPALAPAKVSFSTDGRQWTKLQDVVYRTSDGYTSKYVSYRFWKPVTHEGNIYAIDKGKLVAGTDGVHYEVVSGYEEWKGVWEGPLGERAWRGVRPEEAKKRLFCGNETALRFLPDDTAVVFCRSGLMGTSKPPYTRWAVNRENFTGDPHAYGGPDFIVLPDETILAGSRYAKKKPDGKKADSRMVLFRLEGEELKPVLELPSSGDSGYPSFVRHDGFLWVSYYSGHERKTTGKLACMYLAKIELP